METPLRIFYESLVVHVVRGTIGYSGKSNRISDLKARLEEVVERNRRIIEADRSSDYEHMWSSEAAGAINEEDLANVILEMVKRLEGLNPYSPEALKELRECTSIIGDGEVYVKNRRQVRSLVTEYLLTNAGDDEERQRVERFLGSERT